MKKTIVRLDMYEYADKVNFLEGLLGVDVIPMFNEKIREFVKSSLAAVDKAQDEYVIALAQKGDSADLAFDDANLAHKFAEAFHKATQSHNEEKIPSAQLWYRIGAATGDVALDKQEIFTGKVRAIACRLEEKAKPGEFLVDLNTYNLLLPEIQPKYDPEETVAGKRAEQYIARRCKMINPNLIPNLIKPEPKDQTLVLDHTQRKEFQDALISAFLNEKQLKIMLDSKLGVSLNQVAGGDNYTEIVFELIAQFNSQGRSRDLIFAAYETNPGNPALKRFVEKFK